MEDRHNISPLEEEVRSLTRRLAEKKEKVADAGVEVREKELFREVIREHLEAAREKPGDDTALRPIPTVKPQADESSHVGVHSEDHEKKIQDLLLIAFSKGIVEAVAAARHLNDPHLLDDFHDALADEYYDKLIATGEITP